MTRTHRADCQDCEWRSGPMPGSQQRTPREQATRAKSGHKATFPMHDVEVEPCG